MVRVVVAAKVCELVEICVNVTVFVETYVVTTFVTKAVAVEFRLEVTVET